jgi:hypothetical protein
MSPRSWIAAAVAGGAAVLSGCVVVPDEGYGYGPHYGAPVVRVAPPPVVVVPPRHRHWHWRGGHWGDGHHRGGRYGR